ncbi:DUF4174 domain-containing protein [Hymenobacter sp. UYP22]|uniref:DUF4174 domain-containing protein n=1 Tax=Hymenobacter sp. UYP22 TaxID=3156348 RepID=UPI003390DB4B
MLLRISVVLGCLGLLATTCPAQTSLAALLKASKWQKRVLLLCAPTADDANLRRQQQLLGPVVDDMNARDLLVREVLFDHLTDPDRRYLREQLGVKTTSFTVLLIGKDGGVKQRAGTPLPPARLFTTIDAMPMRRQEMRRP